MFSNPEAVVLVFAVVMVVVVGGLGGIWNNWIWTGKDGYNLPHDLRPGFFSLLVQYCTEKNSRSQNWHGENNPLSLAVEKFRTSSMAGLFFLFYNRQQFINLL